MDGSRLLERWLGSENRLEGSLVWLHLNAGITVCPGNEAGMLLRENPEMVTHRCCHVMDSEAEENVHGCWENQLHAVQVTKLSRITAQSRAKF